MFGAINAACCALSIILPRIDAETPADPFLRSVYKRNPPKPKYSRFWDVSVIFTLLKSWPGNQNLLLKNRSMKVAILLLLTPGHRGQTIVALSLDGLEIYCHEATFELKTLIKSNRTGDPLSMVQLATFAEDNRLCVVSAIRVYLSRTKQIRRSCQLLVSYIQPHKEISRATLARWTTSILKLAGLNTTKYGSHTTHGAMVSKAR